MNGEKGYTGGDVLIHFTEDQVRALPSHVRAALDQLIAELRASATPVPVTEQLADIALHIDDLVSQAARENDRDPLRPGTHLRAALELRADELRIRDVLPRPVDPAAFGTCGIVMKVTQAPPWAVVGDTLLIFGRSPGDDPPPGHDPQPGLDPHH